MQNLSKYLKVQNLIVLVQLKGKNESIEIPVKAAPNDAYKIEDDIITFPGTDQTFDKDDVKHIEVWDEDWDELFERTDVYLLDKYKK